MKTVIDLNADLGEGGGHDAALLERVTSASVSCGAHAGDPAAILETLAHAKRHGVLVGAHPGYPDRVNFGRREQEIGRDEVRRLVVEQVEALRNLASSVGIGVRFIKPHGALYNQACRQEHVAMGTVDAAEELKLPLLGMPRTSLASVAADRGVRVVLEGFPERRYLPDGTLAPRFRPDAVLTDPDEIRAQLSRLLDSDVETLCVHGDDPAAVEKCDVVIQVLQSLGVKLGSPAAIGRMPNGSSLS